MVDTLKLEVGKAYINIKHDKVKILYANEINTQFVGETAQGNLEIYGSDGYAFDSRTPGLYKEFKEKVKQYLLVQVNKHGQANTLTSSLSIDHIEGLKNSYTKSVPNATYHVIEREIDKPND
jgi:hypothetical protein